MDEPAPLPVQACDGRGRGHTDPQRGMTMSGHAIRCGVAEAPRHPPLPSAFAPDDHFFDEDEVLDYVWYEEMRQEDEGPDKQPSGCFTLLFLFVPSASLLGSLLYTAL